MCKLLCVSHACEGFTADCKVAALAAAHNCRVVQPTLLPSPAPSYMVNSLHALQTRTKGLQWLCIRKWLKEELMDELPKLSQWSLQLWKDPVHPPAWCLGSRAHAQITVETNTGVGSKFLLMGSMHIEKNHLVQKLALLWTTSKCVSFGLT